MARILIIDDETALRLWLRVVLEGAGHQVVDAPDGTAGLQALRRQPADLVLCDVFMPERDGLETIRALRREFPHVRVVAMSGGGFDGRVQMLAVAARFGTAK